MAHRSARLSVFSRQLLVDRVIVLGKPVAMVARELGVSRATGYKWVRRYRSDGLLGLEDGSSRPRRSPRALPRERVEAILAARVASRYGPHRLAYLTGHPRSTISGVLGRAGMSRLDQADKLTGVPLRYVACHPGALLHQDHKKLARVPSGGGHRVLGRAPAAGRPRGGGYDHFEVFVDDASRVAFVALVADERPASAVDALERAPDQRQGRALHQDAPRRVGLRAALPFQRRAAGRSAGLARVLQPSATPHRHRWARAACGACQQRRRESQLGHRLSTVI